jgi:hypothetical protein
MAGTFLTNALQTKRRATVMPRTFIKPSRAFFSLTLGGTELLERAT